MQEKIDQIESIKEFITELSIATGIKFKSIKSNWIYPSVSIPEKYKETANKLVDRRLEYQKASKQLHEKYFGN